MKLAEIEDILSRLEKIFNAVKIKYVIVGGIAVIHYGHIRSTQDIDIIIEDDKSKFTQFIGLLRSYDFDVMEDQITMAYQERTNMSIFDKKSYLRLDITVANKKREYDVLNNAILKDLLGYNLRIAPLEYVLIGKLVYMGNIDDIPDSELFEYQDILDFLTLYHANKENINISLLENKTIDMRLKSTLDRLKSIKL